MKRYILKIASILFFTSIIYAQGKPLYQLPELTNKSSNEPFLVGTDNGLYRILSKNSAEPIWLDGAVHQIVKAKDVWYFSTDKGIIKSSDLKTFTECNNGLPFLTIKTYDGKEKKLLKKSQLLKDLCVDPLDSNILVTATKDSVYLSRDGAASWKNIGSMNMKTAGIKAVAVSHMPVYAQDGSISGSEVVVFMSHPISGFSYYRADVSKPAWNDVSAGFYALPSLTQPDEIADLLPVVCKSSDGTLYTELYASQTFIPNIYKFNWQQKKAERIYAGKEQADTIDGLCQSGSNIIFSTLGKLAAFSLEDDTVKNLSESSSNYLEWVLQMNLPHSLVNSSYVPSGVTGLKTSLQLCELWLLRPDVVLTPWGEKALKQKSIYASAYQLRNNEGIAKYRKIVTDNNLTSIVVDMKDDYGLLRFEPNSPLLKQKGKVTGYKIDVDKMVSEFKKDGTYLIGRIVVFKDRNLASYDKKQYAVWDSRTKAPWVGIRGTEDVLDENGNPTGEKKTVYYDENWVDPYSEEVWEYNVEIAKELVERGFDEIQFDYIRFPTDGTNLGRATYRWQDAGMDKESALMSFLAYARKNINAPIGIDIYGANGWYRSGTRTGQDVELMSEYVDVICPMYYPSHFEQDFMEYSPVAERPYRIYFFGSYRNTVIGRNRVVVRPWVQAFYMGVRYDRVYYNKDYVLREIFGVRDGADRGYMYWNNSGGYYEDISPDPKDTELSPWKVNESALQKRLPAFSLDEYGKDLAQAVKVQGSTSRESRDAMLTILDTVLNQGREDWTSTAVSPHLLSIEAVGVVRHD